MKENGSILLGRNIPTEALAVQAPSPDAPTWIRQLAGTEKVPKDTIGHYAAKHFVEYGVFLLMGPGTTPLAAMNQSIEIQKQSNTPQDLEIMTTNLEILNAGHRARQEAHHLFDQLRITLAGGFVSPSMNCLVGDIAAAGILNKGIHPNAVIFGVHGISFDDDICLTYHFSDELSTQTAYAVRPTCSRVILCDATKIGQKRGYAIDVSADKLLADANECIIVANSPLKPSSLFTQQLDAFQNLLHKLHASGAYSNKNLALRLLDNKGGVCLEYSLIALREKNDVV